jgi:regulator of sigma E protease
MIFTVIVFLLLLSVLILVHEAGHFTVSKLLKIRVEEFGFGLPPRIFGIKKGETIYSLNWLPIGGFVRLFGEEGEEKGSKGSRSKALNPEIKKRAFYTRPVWQRASVLLAGVFMNFILGVVVISYLFTQGVMVPTNRVHIEKIVSGSPAAMAGLKEQDVVTDIKYQISQPKADQPPAENIQNVKINNEDQLVKIIKDNLGREITFVVDRKGQTYEYKIIPRKDYPKNQGPTGIVISHYELKTYPFWQAPILGTKEAFFMSWELARGIGSTLWKLVSFQPVGRDVAGPVGIAQLTGQAVKSGEPAVLELLGLLSLNLAIMNVLPFPALDGGRLLFVVIEGVTGKRIKTDWERYVHQVGMIILLTLMVLVTVNDLIRVFSR